MPTYPVKNTKTGEEKELNLTMANYEQWRKDNPDWIKTGLKDVHPQVKWVTGVIKCLRHIQDGKMSWDK